MEWISVKDRLPEQTGLYLVFVPEREQKHPFRRTLWYVPEKGWDSGRERIPPEDWARMITHWMPLPEPPKTRAWNWKPFGDYYKIRNRTGGWPTAACICDALNGSARELLEFAGIEEECDCGHHK